MSENKFYQLLIENLHTVALIKKFFSNKYTSKENIKYKKIDGNLIATEKDLKFSKKITNKLSEGIIKCGTSLDIVYIGWYANLVDERIDYKHTSEFLKFALKTKLFKDLNINFHDLSNTRFLNEVHKNFSKYVIPKEGGHPNEKGAMLIYKAIIKNKIITD